MEIREADESDIPSIVDLLKSSLGEGLMPKSERYWRWKHLDNPFGRSPVLLCWEDGKLIGVRAFMRWEWKSNSKVYRALRAVDTATHPEYQGKGIFKKLTLSLVDNCGKNGDHFIFNTPNQQSRPGYLKMGWVEAGRLPITVSPTKPFSMFYNYLLHKPKKDNQDPAFGNILEHTGLESLLNQHCQQAKTIITSVSPDYLKWRYLTVPVASYVAMGDEQGKKLTSLIIGRIKQTRFGKELRITDCFFSTDIDEERMRSKFQKWRESMEVDYVTLSGTLGRNTLKLFSILNFKASVGPTVTIRSLQLTNLDSFSNFKDWTPSIGDLELF